MIMVVTKEQLKQLRGDIRFKKVKLENIFTNKKINRTVADKQTPGVNHEAMLPANLLDNRKDRIMRAISLHEPWASFIMWGWKSIETRTHDRFRSLENQKIVIHATKNLSFLKNDSSYLQYMTPEQLKFFRLNISNKHFINSAGKLLGTVEVVGFSLLDSYCSERAMIDCSIEKRFGLFLRKPKRFENPVLFKGTQGIFYIPLEVMKDLKYLQPRKDL